MDHGVVKLRGLLAATAMVGVAVAVVATALVVGGGRENGIDIPEGVPPGLGMPVPPIDIDAPGRTADLLHDWAAGLSDPLGVADTALEAYGYATAVLAHTQPECGIGWTTIAGIASVESKHGTYHGSVVRRNGEVVPPIRGVPLDGAPGVAEIPDTDGGIRDGDPVYDRAMGPLQFIPETWSRWGVDANGDGTIDPDNIDDSALTAARYLCASGGDLKTARGWSKALMTYNQSAAYQREVRDRASAYSVGRRP